MKTSRVMPLGAARSNWSCEMNKYLMLFCFGVFSVSLVAGDMPKQAAICVA